MGGFAPGLRQNQLKKTVDWTLTPHLRELAAQYMALHQVSDVSERSLFESTLFSLLAARQDYPKHVSLYANLLGQGYGEPAKIVADKDTLTFRRLLAGASAPNQKRARIVQLAAWWLASALPKQVIADCTNGQHQEFQLRDLYADEVPGVAEKGASMLWGHIGYRRCVPIDTHMVRYLREHGHTEFQQPDYITVGGLRREEYRRAERIISEHADQQGVEPFMYQVAMWIAATGWSADRFIDPKTIDVRAQQQLWDAETLEALVSPKGIPEIPPLLKRWRGKMKPMGGSPPIATPEQLMLYNLEDLPPDGAHVTEKPDAEEHQELRRTTG